MRPPPLPNLSQKIQLSFRKIPRLTVCGVKYTTATSPCHRTSQVLGERRHPQYPLFKDRLDNRDRDALWTSVTANIMVARKVVRSRLTRRLRAALFEVMQELGMDKDGKLMVDKSPGVRGTLELYVLKPLIDMDHTQVKSQMRILFQFVTEQTKQDRLKADRKRAKNAPRHKHKSPTPNANKNSNPVSSVEGANLERQDFGSSSRAKNSWPNRTADSSADMARHMEEVVREARNS